VGVFDVAAKPSCGATLSTLVSKVKAHFATEEVSKPTLSHCFTAFQATKNSTGAFSVCLSVFACFIAAFFVLFFYSMGSPDSNKLID